MTIWSRVRRSCTGPWAFANVSFDHQMAVRSVVESDFVRIELIGAKCRFPAVDRCNVITLQKVSRRGAPGALCLRQASARHLQCPWRLWERHRRSGAGMKKFNNTLAGTDCGDAGLPAPGRDIAKPKPVLRVVLRPPDIESMAARARVPNTCGCTKSDKPIA